MFESCARNFVKEEFGTQAYEQSQVLDIHSADQVAEPIVDCMLLYRLARDPHTIHVYQRRTVVIDQNGWFSNTKVIQQTFTRTHLFELEEYTGIKTEDNLHSHYTYPIDMVAFGPAGICVPKPITMAPICNLIEELKRSKRFIARFEYMDSLVSTEIMVQ
ncbi:Hypothetical protein MVR_LOCUS305 [uncultured virus]|nr:Hypothetical protein MVR_LOCUS305 [uncultured virus]